MAKMKFQPSTDRTPKYTVKEVAEMMELTTYAVRYYDNAGLIPGIDRTDGNIRMFSDYAVSWLKLVDCLRSTGLPIEDVKRYVDMCLKGDSTIPERAELIFKQEKVLRKQIRSLQKQMEVLKYKKAYYKRLLETNQGDACNPANYKKKAEPVIVPHHE